MKVLNYIIWWLGRDSNNEFILIYGMFALVTSTILGGFFGLMFGITLGFLWAILPITLIIYSIVKYFKKDFKEFEGKEEKD